MKEHEPSVITPEFLANYLCIGQEEAERIHPKLERIVYKNGEAIVTAGDAADGLYFIDEGRATVFDRKGETINEMEPGQLFGEYAILADEPRMSTVRAHGRVTAYRMLPEDFLETVSRHPNIAGRLLRQVYGQVSSKHTKLVWLTRRHRGIMWSPPAEKEGGRAGTILTYGLTLALFGAVWYLAPGVDTAQLWWQLLPVAFLVLFTLRTKRILEGLLLTVALLGGMLHEGNYLLGFRETLIEGIGNPDTAETILIMSMVEIFAALLGAAGVVTAFKKLAHRCIRTRRGSMFGMLLILILVCVDECLNVMTAGYCLNEIQDAQGIPREERALLGSFSTAICSMIPFSLWAAYLCGWISMYLDNGGYVFLRTIPFNLAGMYALVMAVMLCAGLLPRSRQIRGACRRVAAGGTLWPEGSEQYFVTEADDGIVGRTWNLLLPMLVWCVSSVVCGIAGEADGFALDAVSGLVITLVFMFVLYVGQRILTPTGYFDIVVDGIRNALVMILTLVLSERMAEAMLELGFGQMLISTAVRIAGGSLFLLPAMLFVSGTFICLGVGSLWGMYGLGIPICIFLSRNLGLPIELCMGAILAAGIVGENLCLYLDVSDPVVTAIGCEVHAYRRLRLRYWIPLFVICTAVYTLLGLILI